MEQYLAAEAYQVIAVLVDEIQAQGCSNEVTAQLTKALDYFRAISNGEQPSFEILPFYLDSHE